MKDTDTGPAIWDVQNRDDRLSCSKGPSPLQKGLTCCESRKGVVVLGRLLQNVKGTARTTALKSELCATRLGFLDGLALARG